MDKKLKRFMDEVSPDESAFLEKSLARTAKKADIESDRQARILAATMRKAGFEMSEAQAKITMKKNRIKKMAVCGIAAAALLSAVGWTAATGGFDRVMEFFRQDMSPYADQIMQTAQVVSNDDITLSVDGVIADEVQCRVVVSLNAKTKRGEEILEQMDYMSYEYMEDSIKLGEKSQKMMDKGTSEEEAREWYLEQVRKLPPHRDTLFFENAGRTSQERFAEEMTEEEAAEFYKIENCFSDGSAINPTRNNKYHYYQMFTIEMSDIDRSQPLILRETESGLSVEIDVNAYFDSHRLVSDDPQAFDYVVISPLAVYIRSTQNDIDNGRKLKDGGYMGDGELTSVIVNHTDGTSEKIDGICIGMGAEWGEYEETQFDTEQEKLEYMEKTWDERTITSETLEASGEKLFDLGTISSVTIDGIEYKIQ